MFVLFSLVFVLFFLENKFGVNVRKPAVPLKCYPTDDDCAKDVDDW